MASSIICKLSFGDETRRFTVKSDEISYRSISRRANEILFLGDAKYKLQYKDDEGDTITMSTDEEMAEAVALALSVTPPILRLTIKMDKPDKPEQPAPTEAAPPAATDLPAVDLSTLIHNIGEHLPKVLEKLPVPAAAAAPPPPSPHSADPHGAILKSVCEQLPKFVESLPPSVRAQIPNAELDVGATIASNIASAMNMGLGGVSFSVKGGGGGYGDVGVHPGVTCDKSGMCPIVGPRFNLKGHNYDLCEAEYNLLDAAEQAKFVRIDPPFGKPY